MKFVLFDLDGTLVDSSAGILRCFEYAFRKMGKTPPSRAELSVCIGPPLLASFRRFFQGDEERALEGVRLYRERYAAEGWRECALYPSARECLEGLVRAGKVLSLATSKPQPFAEKILKNFGINSFFSLVVGSKLDNSFDDKAQIIRAAMESLGADRTQTIMIGDRRHDILGAQANGIPSVGMRIGFAPAGELEAASATYIVDDFIGLSSLLLYGEKEE